VSTGMGVSRSTEIIGYGEVELTDDGPRLHERLKNINAKININCFILEMRFTAVVPSNPREYYADACPFASWTSSNTLNT
jgi:hypothetical protein